MTDAPWHTPTYPDEALHEQREWLRVTLSSIGDAVITTDTSGNVTFLNPVAQSLTGWSLDEASGVPLDAVFKIVNEETRQTVENPAIRALREGLVVGLANHTLLIAKDGTERPIDDSAAPIRNAGGEVAGVVLVFRDVTERRKAEQALRDGEERFRLLVEGVQDYAIFMLDPQGTVVSWNAGAERIKGYRAEEIIGKHFSCFYPPDAVESGWPERELQTAAKEGLFEDEGWRLRKDGSKFWANVVITALRDETGKLKGFSKITRDLSDRKRADAVLKDSEIRYRRLFESAKDGILILDAQTSKIIDSNPFMTDLLGYSHEEFLGKELWEIGLFNDKEASQSVYRELQKNGFIRYDQLPFESKNGKKVEVEFISNVYAEDHHQVVQCNIRDISERCRLERQMQEQAAALAELDHRKDEFLAMLSHELRNPLAPIFNAVQLLQLQKGKSAVQQTAQAIIERQVGQLTHLVDGLMEVSRTLTGRIQLRREQIAVSRIVERAVETARPLIDQRRHELTVSLPPDPIWLYADAARLEQAVVNLLTNAAKYTEKGGHIWLTVQQEDNECVLRVRDTGVGISPELLPHIFDLFTQAERSLDRSQGGLGIGLALVQRLTEMHGGRVEASSAFGQGSEFVVRLPVLSSPALPPPSTHKETAERTARPLRALVVDDNVDAATALELLLQESGHLVRVAHTGPTGLAAALDFRPDVMLLDIGLPELNGFEIARRIRQQPTLRNIVLVALTGYGREKERQRSQEAGFDHHLVKPADFGTLEQILTAVSKKAV
jgi:PAS domain S-box-containing protein